MPTSAPCHSIHFSPLHTKLALRVSCCRLLCLFGAGGEHLFTLGADSGSAQLQQLSWLGDNEVLACSGEEITVWNVTQEQYKELRTFAASNKAPIRHIATSPNGRFIAAACDNGAVSMAPGRSSCVLRVQGR
jgi:WD40 repeat protein